MTRTSSIDPDDDPTVEEGVEEVDSLLHVPGRDGFLDGLTVEQRKATASDNRRLFIEAGPGTGKTSVAAHRFGFHRFSPQYRNDSRAVVALSFTRSATVNLRDRVQRFWGNTALAWPHRIATLDTLIYEILSDLLQQGLVVWPGGCVELEVHDTWTAVAKSTYNNSSYTLELSNKQVHIRTGYGGKKSMHVPCAEVVPYIKKGICTHADVRAVLQQALLDPACQGRAKHRLATTTRALIVDEVFDADVLDISLIRNAVEADVLVTLVGDPWQALYGFRGARPDVVPSLLEEAEFSTQLLSRSFRWDTSSQRALAMDLRNARPVYLPRYSPYSGLPKPDIAISPRWDDLWNIGHEVLPLAFGSFKGSLPEAAATLLLDTLVVHAFDARAIYLSAALSALAIEDVEELAKIQAGLREVLEFLSHPSKERLKESYYMLVKVVNQISPRVFPNVHHNYTKRLGLLASRVDFIGELIPGVTAHQAKGREWGSVCLALTDAEVEHLAVGLRVDTESHRTLYVACTRARKVTLRV